MENKKYPRFIPYSMVKDQLEAWKYNKEQEEKRHQAYERSKNTPYKPYVDLSDRSKKRKDHTGQWFEIYKGLVDELKSNDEKVRDFACLKFGAVCKEIAGRPLREEEMKAVIQTCEQKLRGKRPRHTLNAFGQMQFTKVINPKIDLEKK